MKVIIKFHNRTEIVENVSVDEKCFPLVGGVHPYPQASQQDSQLANQSSLWFKTLAIDCIFVDCDKSEVHWFPVVNEVNPDVGVILRKPPSEHYESSFFLNAAKPLFEDTSLYEMDPSLKGMMLTCSDAMKKLSQKRMAKADFNRAIASILHVYILPSISFTPEDMYCLSRTRCLIEERLNSAENLIKSIVVSIDQLETCLNTLRSNMLYREDFEKEEYLLTCNRNFLVAFVKNLEEVLVSVNLSLEAQQSKVNWAKQHESDQTRVMELKRQRDQIHEEVVKLIRVREAIRNVTTRKDFVSSSLKRAKQRGRRRKSTIVASCFHDIFVEVLRRLEMDNKSLEQLCQDKLNISAAREATMAAINELENNNQRGRSERTTRFEPEDFVDYSLGVNSGSKKSDMWPTFQDRVNAILEKSSSESHRSHVEGCQSLASQVELALSEFNLAMLATKGPEGDEGELCTNQQGGSEDDVQLRKSSSSLRNSQMRSAVCTWKEGIISIHEPTFNPMSDVQAVEALQERRKPEFITVKPNDIELVVSPHSDSQSQSSSDIATDKSTAPADRQGINAETACNESPAESTPHLRRDRYRHRINEKLALSTLLKNVEEVKLAIQAHFSEVINCLSQAIGEECCGFSLNDAEKKELLWKSYERIFFRTEITRLTNMYETLLRPGAQRTYTMLSSTPLQTLLGDDKILQLFYGPVLVSGSQPVDCPSSTRSGKGAGAEDKFSMAKTLSDLSLDVRHCPIEELYDLANADSSEIQKRFQLESSCEDSDLPSSSSSSSSSSSFKDDNRGNSPSLAQTHAFPSKENDSSGHMGMASVLYSEYSECPDQILMLPEQLEDSNLGAAEGRSGQSTLLLSSSITSSTYLNNITEDKRGSRLSSKEPSLRLSQLVLSRLDSVLSPFRKTVHKCLEAPSLLDKMRYIGRAIQNLHRQVWQMLGEEDYASCDDILSMLVVALCHMPEEIFVGLYVNVRLLMDVWPPFLDGTLWNCSLVNLYASYDFLFTHNVCEKVLHDYSGSLRLKL